MGRREEIIGLNSMSGARGYLLEENTKLNSRLVQQSKVKIRPTKKEANKNGR